MITKAWWKRNGDEIAKNTLANIFTFVGCGVLTLIGVKGLAIAGEFPLGFWVHALAAFCGALLGLAAVIAIRKRQRKAKQRDAVSPSPEPTLEDLAAQTGLSKTAVEILQLAYHHGKNRITMCGAFSNPRCLGIGRHELRDEKDRTVAERYLIAFHELLTRGMVEQAETPVDFHLVGEGLSIAMKSPTPKRQQPPTEWEKRGLSYAAYHLLIRMSDFSELTIRMLTDRPAKPPTADRVIEIKGWCPYEVNETAKAAEYLEGVQELVRKEILAGEEGSNVFKLTHKGRQALASG